MNVKLEVKKKKVNNVKANSNKEMTTAWAKGWLRRRRRSMTMRRRRTTWMKKKGEMEWG